MSAPRNSMAVRSSAAKRSSVSTGAGFSMLDSPSPICRICAQYQNVCSMWWTIAGSCDIRLHRSALTGLSSTSGYLHPGEGVYTSGHAGKARKSASSSRRSVTGVVCRVAGLRHDPRSDRSVSGGGGRAPAQRHSGPARKGRDRVGRYRPAGHRRTALTAATAAIGLVLLAGCGTSNKGPSLASGAGIRDFTTSRLTQIIPSLSFNAESPWNVQAENNGTSGITGYDAADQLEVAVQGPSDRVTEIEVVLDTSTLSDMSDHAISDAGALVDYVAGAHATDWAQSVLEADNQGGTLGPTTQNRVFGKDRVTVIVNGVTSFDITPAGVAVPENPSMTTDPFPSSTLAETPPAGYLTIPAGGTAQSVGCDPGSLDQAYTDQGAPAAITGFLLVSCDSQWALAVGRPLGMSSDQMDMAIFKIGVEGAQLMDVVPSLDAARVASRLGMPASAYVDLTGSLHS